MKEGKPESPETKGDYPMIKASEAAQNVINVENERYKKVGEKVLSLAEEMSASIEFRSKLGLSTLEFTPYNVSRFPFDYELNIASKILEKIFRENGYTIEKNSVAENSFKIKW